MSQKGTKCASTGAKVFLRRPDGQPPWCAPARGVINPVVNVHPTQVATLCLRKLSTLRFTVGVLSVVVDERVKLHKSRGAAPTTSPADIVNRLSYSPPFGRHVHGPMHWIPCILQACGSLRKLHMGPVRASTGLAVLFVKWLPPGLCICNPHLRGHLRPITRAEPLPRATSPDNRSMPHAL